MATEEITPEPVTGPIRKEQTNTPPTIQPLAIEEPQTPFRSRLRTCITVGALCLVDFISALDITITATSVPVITADLHSSSGYLWIGGAFLLANAAASPIWGKLSDIFGRKLVLLTNVVLFAIGSTFAATSVNMRMLIAARALQGMAAGGLNQVVNIVISDLFSQRDRAIYYGILEVQWAVAAGVGPVLGGAFTQLVSWRWCFWINLPVCGLSFILLFLYLNVHNPRTSLRSGVKAIDWFGTLSILSVTLLLLLGLDFGGATYPWSSPTTLCLIVFGVVMIAFFILSEKKLAKYPLVPFQIFHNNSTTAAFMVVFIQGLVFVGPEYYLPLYFQSVKNASPLRSGTLILPITISEAVMGVLSGLIINKYGRYREIIWAGVFLLTVGMGLYINFSVSTSLPQIIITQIVEACGAGLLFQPPLIAIQATVSQADTATATATMGFVRNMATALGTIIGGIVFQNGMSARTPSLRAAGLNSTLVDAFTGQNAAASVETIQTIHDHSQRHAVKEAYAWSFRNMWIMYTCISAVGLVAAAFLKHRELQTEHTETRTGIDEMKKRDGGGEDVARPN